MQGSDGRVDCWEIPHGAEVSHGPARWRTGRRGAWSCLRLEERAGFSSGLTGPYRSVGRPAVWPKTKARNPFGILIEFWNLPRLWKFVQGDLEGILWRGFFLNYPRLSKDFRKIQYVMPCNAPKRN
jgi:hypothetical protein